MRFGSVCSGIEAASVAWHPLGWQAAWLSEIEPFPSAVLAHHYPNVPNLGDMTALPDRILSGEVEAPDLFCGGTPCQAFSVAGLRNSLDDARGNLSLTFVGIANAIDHVRSVRSAPPAIIFWENVPGVLSTKDNAFGCFLAALAGEDDPIIPPGEKWTNAGCVYGPQRAVAWRVLDAQYFGVAQRRRRVFVVASARDDFDPAAVLFEFDSVRRDTAPSREKGKAVASGVRTGAAVSSHWDGDYPHPTLNQSAKGSGGVGSSNQEIFSQRGAYLAPQPMVLMDQGGSVMNVEHDMVGTLRRETHGHEPVVAVRMVSFGEYVDDGTASAMKARDYKDATDLVAQPIPLNSMNVLRSADADPTTGCGIGEAGEAMFTLTKGNHHAVAQPMVLMDQGGSVMNVEHDMVGTLRRETHGHEPVAMQSQTIAAFKGGQGSSAGGIGYDEHVSPTLSAADSGSNRTPALLTAMQVRRLTPVECERLQGFPDNYTAIPWRKKPAGDCPDGPRYKALGNSWAVPNVRWIGKRIQEALNALT